MKNPAFPLKNIKTIRDLQISGQPVFIRMDFNVPLGPPNEEGIRSVADDSRIMESLPTIQYAIEKGAKIILASHLGRPDGKKKSEYSMEPIANSLATLLKQDVTLADGCTGDGIEMMIQSMKQGQILLLENLRFHPGEEANDIEFARKLSRLAPIYITDAFGTAHRKHASTYGVPSLTSQKGIGFLIERELTHLDPLLHQPSKPFVVLLGGAKVTDKIKTIESLMRKADAVLIGGAMGHAFWAAQDIAIPEGAKHPKPEDVEAARALLKEARKKELTVITPLDTESGFDIGPKTIQKFCDILSRAKTVFWNGPLGWFEKPEFAQGTFEVARFLAEQSSTKIIGGGDTVSAIKQAGLADRFTHLSTGGGAVLEYLEGNGLPGIDILKLNARERQQIESKNISDEDE